MTKLIDKNNVKHHFVYKTTNLINGKWYIGKHSTYNLDDGYLGSSKHLKSAIKKYGKHKFKREILVFCDSEQDAYIKEAELVTMEVVQNPMTYNKMPGGEGGQKRFTDEELNEHLRERQRKWREANSERKREYYEVNRERILECRQEYYEANRERILEQKRVYNQTHRERIRKRKQEYYAANRDEYNARRRAKYAANKNKNL